MEFRRLQNASMCGSCLLEQLRATHVSSFVSELRNSSVGFERLALRLPSGPHKLRRRTISKALPIAGCVAGRNSRSAFSPKAISWLCGTVCVSFEVKVKIPSVRWRHLRVCARMVPVDISAVELSGCRFFAHNVEALIEVSDLGHEKQIL